MRGEKILPPVDTQRPNILNISWKRTEKKETLPLSRNDSVPAGALHQTSLWGISLSLYVYFAICTIWAHYLKKATRRMIVRRFISSKGKNWVALFDKKVAQKKETHDCVQLHAKLHHKERLRKLFSLCPQLTVTLFLMQLSFCLSLSATSRSLVSRVSTCPRFLRRNGGYSNTHSERVQHRRESSADWQRFDSRPELISATVTTWSVRSVSKTVFPQHSRVLGMLEHRRNTVACVSDRKIDRKF